MEGGAVFQKAKKKQGGSELYLHEVGVLSQDGACDLLVVFQKVVREGLHGAGNCGGGQRSTWIHSCRI